MQEKLARIKEEALAKLAAAGSMDVLNEIRLAYLGKKGELTEVLKGMRDVAPEDRPKVGEWVNSTRKAIEERLASAQKEIAEKAGFNEHVGCHTMRKTFAWNLYESTGRNLAIVQKQLNHSSQEATIHYLGLDQKAMDNAIMNMPSFV